MAYGETQKTIQLAIDIIHTLIIHSTIARGTPPKARPARTRSSCPSKRAISSPTHTAAAATNAVIMDPNTTVHQSMHVEDDTACCTRVARTAPFPKHSSTYYWHLIVHRIECLISYCTARANSNTMMTAFSIVRQVKDELHKSVITPAKNSVSTPPVSAHLLKYLADKNRPKNL